MLDVPANFPNPYRYLFHYVVITGLCCETAEIDSIINVDGHVFESAVVEVDPRRFDKFYFFARGFEDRQCHEWKAGRGREDHHNHHHH